jgi:hypothetical protein
MLRMEKRERRNIKNKKDGLMGVGGAQGTTTTLYYCWYSFGVYVCAIVLAISILTGFRTCYTAHLHLRTTQVKYLLLSAKHWGTEKIYKQLREKKKPVAVLNIIK